MSLGRVSSVRFLVDRLDRSPAHRDRQPRAHGEHRTERAPRPELDEAGTFGFIVKIAVQCLP